MSLSSIYGTESSPLCCKTKSIINIVKICDVLLMDTDYNFINKLLLGIRIVRMVEAHNGFPDELSLNLKLHEAVESR